MKSQLNYILLKNGSQYVTKFRSYLHLWRLFQHLS